MTLYCAAAKVDLIFASTVPLLHQLNGVIERYAVFDDELCSDPSLSSFTLNH